MTSKRFIQIFSFLLLGFTALNQSPASDTPEKQAQDAEEQWLALLDAGKFAESWQSAASVFQAAITQLECGSILHSVRKPLGSLVSRKAKSANYTKPLPGAPDGEFVILEFDTFFFTKKHVKKRVVERVTAMLDVNKEWKVSRFSM